MKPTPLARVAAQCGGTLIAGSDSRTVDIVSTDTRGLVGGELFVALAGEHFDAHDFIGTATDAGAGAVMVSRSDLDDDVFGRAAVIRVKDTLVGLQKLAAAQRQILDPEVVGITGSSGKTSTKDMLRAVLSSRFEVSATLGNLNNHIGLPLSVLATTVDHQACVWEMGMNHRGEIAPLAAIAQPDVAVVTNIGVAHIEHLKTREEICAEKGDLIAALDSNGTAIFPDCDDFADALSARAAGRVIRPRIGAGEVSAHNLQPTANGTRFVLDCGGQRADVELAVHGEHMVRNALLAAATGYVYEIPLSEIAASLGDFLLTGGRLEPVSVGDIDFLNDSYNANPESMAAALQTLATVPCGGRRIAVLGRMGELGDIREAEHRKVGTMAGELGNIDFLFTVGEEADWIRSAAGSDVPGQHFSDHKSCVAHLISILSSGDRVLLKGSRAARMEEVLAIYRETVTPDFSPAN